jgi:hypothetical protein
MPLETKYFVIKPRSKTKGDPHAEASRAAMHAYARVIATHDTELCEQLHEWACEEKGKANALND